MVNILAGRSFYASLVLLLVATCTCLATHPFAQISVPHLTDSQEAPPGQEHWKGGAWTDVDNDGDLDFLVTGPASYGDTTLVYWLENAGKGAFSTRALPIIGVSNEVHEPRRQVLAADFDNDGNVDLYVGACDYVNILVSLVKEEADPFSSFPLDCSYPLILKGDGTGQFVAVPNNGLTIPNMGSYAATVGDVNGDGLLDLYIGESLFGGPNLAVKDAYRSRLYLNKGGLEFEESGLDVHNPGCCVAVFVDMDQDGDQDLVTASCILATEDEESEVGFAPVPGPLILYRNTLKETGELDFEDATEDWTGEKVDSYFMNACVGDLNKDGVPDLYLGNTAGLKISPGPHFLYMSQPNGTWRNEIDSRGINPLQDFNWGCAMLDMDRDGDLDLVTVGSLFQMNNTGKVFMNDGGGTFSEVGDLGLGQKTSSGIAVADFDGNHAMDIAVVGRDHNATSEKVFMYSNAGQDGNSFVEVKLLGVRSNREGIGASVSVCKVSNVFSFLDCNTQYVMAGDGFGSTNSHTLLFGVQQSNSGSVRVIVKWPSGVLQERVVKTGNRYLFVELAGDD